MVHFSAASVQLLSCSQLFDSQYYVKNVVHHLQEPLALTRSGLLTDIQDDQRQSPSCFGLMLGSGSVQRYKMAVWFHLWWVVI